ncbi:ArsR family transcriptional regulator [Paenibacillus nanensis]|uniref:ArsR family transcriptional regulator n=1 Tax=Paenibacillus nanensis TaxID=393251 RepID=A0A3A1VIS1_9BACL|nr:ArsR family transcriptional regulator [Paenibacillus nanensis]RIX59612.1 ArsR family transcriptional regulator [Paenibacillus nanensis]
MLLTTDSASLKVYEALASEARLKIIDLLYRKEMHIKELASELYLSNAIVSSHVNKLEQAGIVGSRMRRVNGGTYKYCYVKQEYMQVKLSPPVEAAETYQEIAVPVGHFTDYEVWPTCGIATTAKIIGDYDNPACFMDPERVNAGILWFARGFVEYKVPNYLRKDQRLKEIGISMEIGSEAPQVNENWPSDIRFTLNQKMLGVWTSPGDFGEQKGRLTPKWWHKDVNQYGVLKALRINERGTYIDGQRISDVTLSELQLDRPFWTFSLSPEGAGSGRGGLTLFGKGFGNYDQDLVIRYYYDALR